MPLSNALSVIVGIVPTISQPQVVSIESSLNDQVAFSPSYYIKTGLFPAQSPLSLIDIL